MKRILSLVAMSSLFLVSCAERNETAVTSAGEPEAKSILRDVGAEEAAEMISSREDLVILDIRTPQEFAEGHIAGAVNIDYRGDDFAEKVGALDPDKAYLFHCRSGGRSGDSIPLLKELGFSELYHLNSGILGWGEAGQSLQK
ncbi:MAG: rhodanese-like domain-containing protein [Verrucomicrobiota bacterium]